MSEKRRNDPLSEILSQKKSSVSVKSDWSKGGVPDFSEKTPPSTKRFLSPAADEACQFVTGVVGKNPLLLRELNLSGRELGDTGVNHFAALLQDKHCRINTLTLNNNSITAEGCAALTSAFNLNPVHLRELDLSGNKLGNSGIEKICHLLKNTHCRLKKLKLCDCGVTEEGYKALSSALRSNPSHLIELELTGNDPGESGVKELSNLLQDPHCQLNTLRFLSPAADEACQFVTGAMGKNPLLLRELDLSRRELGDTGVNQLSALLKDKHCRLNTLHVYRCSITEKQSLILTSALKSNPSHLRDLNLNFNNLGDSGVKNLSDLLMEPQFKLEKLDLRRCSITEKQSLILTSALKSNPSHLRDLNLSGNKLGDSGVKNLSDLLMEPQFKLEKLDLSDCSITEKQSLILTSALKSNPSHLRDLDLSDNNLGDSGVKNLSDLLMEPQFKLEKLDLRSCSITDKQSLILTSALKSNPSHLRDLNLSWNQIRNSGVNHLCDVLKDSHCKLERLSLFDCGITDVSPLTQSLTNTKLLQFLKELRLNFNKIGSSKEQLIDVIRDSNCKLSMGLQSEEPKDRCLLS